MKSLGDRLQWILDNRGKSAASLSKAAGKAPQQLSTSISRMRLDPERDIEVRTLVAIARTAGVSVSWLATGEGAPDDAEAGVHRWVEHAARYPNLERAVDNLRGLVSDEALLEARHLALRSDVDLEPETWMTLLRQLSVRLKGKSVSRIDHRDDAPTAAERRPRNGPPPPS